MSTSQATAPASDDRRQQVAAVVTDALRHATRINTAIGDPVELYRYRTTGGIRRVIGQRVAGRVCITDHALRNGGALCVVARNVTTIADLTRIVADHVLTSERLDAPACPARTT